MTLEIKTIEAYMWQKRHFYAEMFVSGKQQTQHLNKYIRQSH